MEEKKLAEDYFQFLILGYSTPLGQWLAVVVFQFLILGYLWLDGEVIEGLNPIFQFLILGYAE